MPYAAAALLLIGFGLRAFRLGSQSLWWDETYSVDVARQGPLAIVSQARADPLPHFFALWAWMTGAGASEYAARYMSLLLGMLALPLLYQLVRQVSSRRAALLAVALMAVSGLAVYYSQEVRLHMLGLVLVLAVAYALLVAVRTNRSAMWVMYGVLASAALYSHYYAALALLGLNLPLLLWGKVRREPGWWFANGLAALAFVPWAATAYGRLVASMAGETTGNFAPGPAQFIADSAVFMLFGRTADPLVSLVPALLGLVLLLAACWMGLREADPRRWTLVGYALLPLAGNYALALALPGTYDVRYSLLALPAWLALLALSSSTSFDWRPWRAVLAGLGAAAFIIPTAWSLTRNYAESSVARDDYRAAFAQVRSQALPSDVLLYDSPVQITALDYYFAAAPIATASVPLGAAQAAIADQLAELQRRHQGVWLLLALDRRHSVERWLDAFATPESNQWFGGGLRLKHYLPAPQPLAETSLPNAEAVHVDVGPLRLEQLGLADQLPSDSLPLSLLWSASERPNADLTVSLQLFGPDGAKLAQFDQPPLQGASPTSFWQPGEAYVDELRLPLPAAAGAAGVYQLRASVYGPNVLASRLTTIATLSRSGSWRELPVQARTDGGWSIDAARLGSDAAGGLLVHINGLVERAPAGDFTWFAHLLDAQGKLLSQDDHPPIGPARSWRPSEHVLSDFVLPMAPGASVVEVGAYSPGGQRVMFARPDGSSSDAVLLPLS